MQQEIKVEYVSWSLYFILWFPISGIGRDSHISVPNPTSLSDDAIKAVASAAVNLQQLSLGKEQPAATPTEENCGLVLPNDLQVFSADCSHLSFGTYKSGKSTALSQPQASSSLTKDLEGTFTAPNGPSSVHLTSRYPALCLVPVLASLFMVVHDIWMSFFAGTQ